MSNTEKKNKPRLVTFSETCRFDGLLKFKETLCIKGKFHGTIDAQGALIVDKGAVVEADHIFVTSLTVYGRVTGMVRASDKVDLFPGAEMHGDLTTARFRIADGVIFEGQCSMTGVDKEIEIFSRPTEEIKAELRGQSREQG
ncbi:MAG: polymer-forming cytoskeletal protein [Treponema sp.]|jgi:cytoskeletal protein CcmA (bactofilin family)|nr:polymer-forming cytoskeletal protein [Treponema sp.]